MISWILVIFFLTIVGLIIGGTSNMLVLLIAWAKQVVVHAVAHDDSLRMENMVRTVELDFHVREAKTIGMCQLCRTRNM